MTLRIQRSAAGDAVVLALSGRIRACRKEPGRNRIGTVERLPWAAPGSHKLVYSHESLGAVTSRPGNSRNSSLLGLARRSGHCAHSQPTIDPKEVRQRTRCGELIDLRKHTLNRRKE